MISNGFSFCIALSLLAEGTFVRIYLLQVNKEGPIFYSEGLEGVAENMDAAPERGVRAWLERKYKGLQSAILESEQGVGGHMRRAWEWLHRRTSPDESLLRSLRSANTIEIFHPTTMTPEETRTVWLQYLASRNRRHIWWFIINFIISPLTLLLAPIPGPNIIGYWFVYRAVCHMLALLGVRRARSRQVVTTFHPSSALDEARAESSDQRVARIATIFGLKNLESFIEHTTTQQEGPRNTPLAVP